MTGKTSPLFNIIQQLTLKPFTQKEADEFVQKKGTQAGLGDAERAFLLQATTTYGPNGEKQWPPLLLQLAGQLLLDDKRAAQTDPDRYRSQDIRYQLDFQQRLKEQYATVVRAP